jgi:peptidoglycan/xylan/chitin deacetylase (PgdA/CDA1 family)
MKRRITIAIALIFALIVGPPSLMVSQAHAASVNLISNSSVETAATGGATPEGWQTGNWGTNTPVFTYDTSGHTGTRSAKVQMNSYTDGDAKWYFAPVAITAGQKYDFSDYYKSTVPTSLVAQFDNGAGTYSYIEIGAAATSSNWTQAATTVTAPAGMKNLTVFHLISSLGTLSVDDASLSVTAASSTPSVTVTTPTAGTTVSGTTTLAATASDTNGIAGVQLKVDGVNVGSEVTTAPYQTSWNTTTVANGTHTVTAVARNAQGTTATSSGVAVTVSNATSSNLVPNPSLETADPLNGTQPLNWRTDSWGTNTSSFSYLNSGAHSGSKSVQTKVTAYTDGDAKWYFDPVAVTPGSQYRFSDYYKATVQTEVVTAFTMSDGSAVYQSIGLPEKENTVWANFSTTFTVPAGATSMTVFHIIAAKGTLTIDDASLTPYTPVGFNRALVSLTFDDGYASTYTNGLPLLQKYGLTSTQFIVSGLVNTTDYMTAAQVKALSTAGHEIGSHSVTHPDMTTLTKTQYDRELTNSQTKLQQWIGKPVTNFAFPEGHYNQAIITDAKPLYASTRSVEAGLNSKDTFNAYDIKVQNIDATTTAAQVAGWVAQAQATKTWLVLVYHSVDPTNTGDYNVTPTNLDAQLAAVKNSGAAVLTTQQALTELTPQL